MYDAAEQQLMVTGDGSVNIRGMYPQEKVVLKTYSKYS
jgi:hypothetical protein